MSGDGFLKGILWGSVVAKPGRDEVNSAHQRANHNAQVASGMTEIASKMVDVQAALVSMRDSWQDATYVERTKLEARKLTEAQLHDQLKGEGLTRVPLADIESFEEAYLLNLIKTRQDSAIIQETYDGKRPERMDIQINEWNDELKSRLEDKGIHIQPAN